MSFASSQRPPPFKDGHGPSSGNEDDFLVPEELLCAAIPWLTVETNLSSVAEHPPPIAKRTPDSHTRPCKERDNWACIDTPPAEVRPCVRERSRQDQSIRSLLYSEADLPQSDRDSLSYSHHSHCRMLIIRLRLLLIQLAGPTGRRDHREWEGNPQGAFRVARVENVCPGKIARKLLRAIHMTVRFVDALRIELREAPDFGSYFFTTIGRKRT